MDQSSRRAIEDDMPVNIGLDEDEVAQAQVLNWILIHGVLSAINYGSIVYIRKRFHLSSFLSNITFDW